MKKKILLKIDLFIDRCTVDKCMDRSIDREETKEFEIIYSHSHLPDRQIWQNEPLE